MIHFTVFDPMSGRALSYNSCSHEEDVWHQPMVGQGFVLDWKEASWVSAGDEGFVRDETGFVRTQEWLAIHWPSPGVATLPSF